MRAYAEPLHRDRDLPEVVGPRDIDDYARCVGRGLQFNEETGSSRKDPDRWAVLGQQRDGMTCIPGGDELKCALWASLLLSFQQRATIKTGRLDQENQQHDGKRRHLRQRRIDEGTD